MLYAVVIQLNTGADNGLGVELADFADHLSACNFRDKKGGALGCIKCSLGVCAALEAEAGVCGKSLALGGFADAHGVEVCALDEDINGAVRYAGIFTAEYAGNAHGAFGIGYDNVKSMELAVKAV